MVLKEITVDEYASLAANHVGVFGTKEWLSVYDKITCVGIFVNETQMTGGFYYVRTKIYGLDFIKTPPYTPHTGLFFINESKNQASRNNTTKDVLGEVCNYISGQKAKINVLSFPPQITDMQVFFWDKYKVVPHYTYQIDLSLKMEEITANFDSKNRNKINKAAKQGVSVEENILNGEELFRFFKSTLHTTGANMYEDVLYKILNQFPTGANSFSLTAKYNSTMVGNVFCIYDKQRCYYILGGVIKDSGVPGVNNLLLQKSIEKAKQLGCVIYDFEGSIIKGVEVFFRGFGGKLVPYFSINKANLVVEMLLKLKKRETF